MDNNKTMIPGAIIIAGLLIAGAVFYNGGGGTGGAEKTQSLEDLLNDTAKKVGANVKDFNECLESNRHVQRVQDDTQDAQRAGGTGTPYSVVITKSGQTIPISGAQPYESVASLIDALLAGQEVDAPELTLNDVTEKDHVRGDRNAELVLVEYSDIDCPFCQRFHVTMNQVMEKYGESGQVAWVYRHLPLTNIHPNAGTKAVASECIAELEGNDAFWEFLDLHFTA